MGRQLIPIGLVSWKRSREKQENSRAAPSWVPTQEGAPGAGDTRSLQRVCEQPGSSACSLPPAPWELTRGQATGPGTRSGEGFNESIAGGEQVSEFEGGRVQAAAKQQALIELQRAALPSPLRRVSWCERPPGPPAPRFHPGSATGRAGWGSGSRPTAWPPSSGQTNSRVAQGFFLASAVAQTPQGEALSGVWGTLRSQPCV